MAVTAVVFKFHVAAQDIPHDSYVSEAGNVCLHTVQFLNYAVFGAALVGATVLVLGKARGQVGRLQPGHWFILIRAAVSLLLLFVWAIRLPLDRSSLPVHYASHSVCGAIMLLSAAAYFLAARRVWHDCPWAAPALVAAIVDAAFGGGELWAMVPMTGGRSSLWPTWHAIVGVAFFVAMLIDLGRGARRDWVHWLGAVVIVVGNALHVVSWAVIRFTFVYPAT